MAGTRDPSSHRTPAQIRKMDRGYNATAEMIKKRGMNNAARAMMKKKVGAAAIAGKDIDHKNPLRNGGGNSKGNLRIRSQHANRGWESKR